MPTEVVRTMGNDLVAVWCPACDDAVVLGVNTPHGWTFDGNMEKPTFEPSIKVMGNTGTKDTVCHSFLRAGVWQFLDDCTHAMRGMMPVVPFPEYWG